MVRSDLESGLRKYRGRAASVGHLAADCSLCFAIIVGGILQTQNTYVSGQLEPESQTSDGQRVLLFLGGFRNLC